MAKKKKRHDTRADSAPLTSNPFAGLKRAIGRDLPETPAQPPRQPDKTPPYRVERTRKGGYPISIEKRPKGKVVTIVRSVSGDADALLSTLKKACGAGGCIHADTVEIQGDHRDRVEALLRDLNA